MATEDSTNDDQNVAAGNWESYVFDRDNGHIDYLNDSDKFNRFYWGDQWDEGDRQELEEEGRPALSINQVLPTINTVLGEQASSRMVLNFKPSRNADSDTAQLLRKLSAHIIDEQEYMWKESEVFADGLIQDRGYFDIRMNFEDNMYGEIDITTEDPNDIVLDAEASEYDPSTWTRVTKTRWMSPDQVEAEYGEEAAEKIGAHLSSQEDFDNDAWSFRNTFATDGQPYRYEAKLEDGTFQLRSVRLIERQHKEFARDCRFFLTELGDYFIVPPFMDEETADYVAVANGYQVIERPGFRIRWTVTAGGGSIVLHDDWSPYPWFTIVPFFPYFRRGKPFGMVRNLVSPQEQFNKLSSQELHIINSTANSGWIIEENSLGDGLRYDDVEKHGSQTGFVMSFKAGRTPPQKIQANQVPTGIDRMAQKSQAFIRDISGVSAPMQGNNSPYMSGKALQDQIQRSQVQIQKPLDNLARTRRMIGERILYLIQTYYTEERTYHIGSDLEPGETDEEVMINQQAADGIVNDVTTGKYKVVVTQQPVFDNYQDAQRMELLEYRQAGVAVPDHLIIKYSNLADKEELSEVLKQRAGLSEPSPEEQQLAEFERQSQMQSIQLDLAKKQAQVEELMAKVDLTRAETASEIDPNAIKNVLEIVKLQNDMKKNIDNLATRMRMSEMANQVALQKTGAQNMVNMRGQDMQQETEAMRTALSQLPEDQNDGNSTQR